MSDHKTVTFDALIEYLEQMYEANQTGYGRHAPEIVLLCQQIRGWIDLLKGRAAPTPAAQSVGQEPVAERCARFAELYRDEHASNKCCEEACNEIAQACRDYAAPVNASEPVAWAVIDNGQVMTFVRHGSDAEKTTRKVGYTLRPLVYGDAAPVNGGEREAMAQRIADLEADVKRLPGSPNWLAEYLEICRKLAALSKARGEQV